MDVQYTIHKNEPCVRKYKMVLTITDGTSDTGSMATIVCKSAPNTRGDPEAGETTTPPGTRTTFFISARTSIS